MRGAEAAKGRGGRLRRATGAVAAGASTSLWSSHPRPRCPFFSALPSVALRTSPASMRTKHAPAARADPGPARLRRRTVSPCRIPLSAKSNGVCVRRRPPPPVVQRVVGSGCVAPVGRRGPEWPGPARRRRAPTSDVCPAWARSWRCKSSRKLTTASEGKHNCARVTERGEEVWNVNRESSDTNRI